MKKASEKNHCDLYMWEGKTAILPLHGFSDFLLFFYEEQFQHNGDLFICAGILSSGKKSKCNNLHPSVNFHLIQPSERSGNICFDLHNLSKKMKKKHKLTHFHQVEV